VTKGVVFEAASEKLKRTNATGHASLCVQKETVPYKYVTAEGPTYVGGTDDEIERSSAHRCLGQEIGDIYLAAIAASVSVVVRLTPTRWRTVDYTALVDRVLVAPTS
jgi:hypothetical protein